METKITIQNVVASATFKQTLDINAIVMAFPDIVYQPNKFPGLVFKLKKPKSCALIFHSGRMVGTGAKSERLAKRAILTVAKQLKNVGIVLGRPEIEITNVVASVDLGGVGIDLLGLYEAGRPSHPFAGDGFGGSIIYEPDQFPGLMFRMKNPRVVFLVFSTGKLVCVGAKREEEVYEATEKLVALLEEKDVLLKEATPED